MRNKRLFFLFLFFACFSLLLTSNTSVARVGFRGGRVGSSFRVGRSSSVRPIGRHGAYRSNNRPMSAVEFFTGYITYLFAPELIGIIFGKRESEEDKAHQNQMLPRNKQQLLSGKLVKGLDINKTFLTLQHAWMQKDMTLARQYMTARLESNLTKMLDEMSADFEVNIMEDIKLLSASVLHISQKDIWLSLSGRMVDYTMNILTNELVKGSKDQANTFYDVWRFKKVNGVWLADQIIPNAKTAFYHRIMALLLESRWLNF